MRPLRIWDRKRSQHAVAEGSMTRNLVQRAGDVLRAPPLNYTRHVVKRGHQQVEHCPVLHLAQISSSCYTGNDERSQQLVLISPTA